MPLLREATHSNKTLSFSRPTSKRKRRKRRSNSQQVAALTEEIPLLKVLINSKLLIATLRRTEKTPSRQLPPLSSLPSKNRLIPPLKRLMKLPLPYS
jgi:hypothetical protein